MFITSNKDTTTEKDKEAIELKKDELTKYLGYIPKDYVINEENNVYAKPKKVNDIDKKVLLGSTIDYANKFTELAKPSKDDMTVLTYDKKEIDELMSKLYNVKAENVTLTEFGCTQISLKNNVYEQSGGCGGGATEKLLSYIDDYVATKDTLTIYEYNVYYKAFLGSSNDSYVLIKDMYTKKEKNMMNICSNSKDYDNYESCAQDYLEKHRQEFTKYKHTFKRGNDSYYWFEIEET